MAHSYTASGNKHAQSDFSIEYFLYEVFVGWCVDCMGLLVRL